ncbi:hypothetical protein AB0J27_20205 [Micromonospora chokoriensis]
MTRAEAMSDAVEIVEELTEGTPKPGSAPDRVAAAIAVASFLLGLDEDGEEVDEDADEEPTVSGIVGAVQSVSCCVTPSDGATADAFRGPLGTRVRLGIREGGSRSMVILTPADARRFAAGLLNAADEADGTAGLPFGLPASA